MKKPVYIYTSLIAAFFTIALFTSYSSQIDRDSIPAIPKLRADGLGQVVQSNDLNRPYDFAGEALPMDNFDVRERLDRELAVNSYWQSSTMQNLKLSARYFPIFERIFAEEGIPDDFKYLAVAESSLRHPTSSAGAKGMWQFMKGTAADYGLEVNSEVDERMHVEKVTRAACKYLHGRHERLGNWTLAAAAYNAGQRRITSEMESQRATSYYDLNLNAETGRYVFRVVAIKEIMKNPEKHGFYLSSDEYYTPLDDFSIVTTNEPIPNLGDFAQKYGISYRMLKVYNPWLKAGKLTNSKKKTYEIKIPRVG